MLPVTDVNTIKADLLDRILRSSVPALWYGNDNGDHAVYNFNEVTVAARFNDDTVEVIDFTDHS